MNQSDSIDDSNMEIRAFQRNVYLAGLQLHPMDPALCRHVAEVSGREHLTPAELLSELQPQEVLADRSDTASEHLSQLHKIREEVAALKPLLEQQSLHCNHSDWPETASVPEPERIAAKKRLI
jgi:hypothetical protein